MKVKTIGQLWYWSYQYTDYEDLCFTSDMVPTADLKPGELCLPEADSRVVLPIELPVHILISSEDILHSRAVPALGLNTDVIPGHLNQATVTSNCQVYSMAKVQKSLGLITVLYQLFLK